MTKFVELTYSEWVEKFKPIPNHFNKHDVDNSDINFETYGEEHDFIKSKIDERLVWTWSDGDMCSYISNGYHYINRINYHVCSVPYDEDTDYQIITSTEEECKCYSDEEDVIESRGGEQGDPNCTECEGYGLVTVYND